MRVEAALLTGGASRRMGQDKASIRIGGIPQAERIANALKAEDIVVTILGKSAIAGYGFLADNGEFAGPLAALSRFEPHREVVFVCSCDLPLFDARIVHVLANSLGGRQAAVPMVNRYRQPLCAIYTANAFSAIPEVLAAEGACTMRWLDSVPHVVVPEEQLKVHGLDPQCAQGANTREEFEAMLVNRSR
jgi:molybdopterin-guanine dinucleotide biosynthesis protein A